MRQLLWLAGLLPALALADIADSRQPDPYEQILEYLRHSEQAVPDRPPASAPRMGDTGSRTVRFRNSDTGRPARIAASHC